jgi:hypothetical protein
MSEVWKPKPGEIIGYQWGGFPSDSCPVLFVSEDPWECAEIYETPEPHPKHLPDAGSIIHKLRKPDETLALDAVPVLQRHGFYDEAIALLHDVIKELRHDLTLKQDTIRRQAEFIAANINSPPRSSEGAPE